MIVKLIKDFKYPQVWLVGDDGRLVKHFTSEKDLALADKLLTVHHYENGKVTDSWVGSESYFMAYYLKDVIQLTKRVGGYKW